MMHRREFLRRAALIAAGVVAADQLDVLEMLAPRRLFAGADFNVARYGGIEHRIPLTLTQAAGSSLIEDGESVALLRSGKIVAKGVLNGVDVVWFSPEPMRAGDLLVLA